LILFFFKGKYAALYLQSKPNLNIQKSFPVTFSKKEDFSLGGIWVEHACSLTWSLFL